MIKMNLIGNIYYALHKLSNKFSHVYLSSVIDGEVSTLSIKGRSRILFPEKMKVGKNCCINDSVIMHCGGGITLGDNVTISTGAMLVSRSYDTTNWIQECQKDEWDMSHIEDGIFLGNHTWVAAGAIILPGTKITGKGVIIAAGAVLSGEIKEDYVLVAGVPAKIIKRFDENDYLVNNKEK